MTTDELLEKIGKLLEAEREHTKGLFEAEREHTRKLVHEEVGAAKNEIMARIEREAETYAEFFHKTWELIEKNEHNLTQRVEQIEGHLELTDPTKNN